MAKAMCVCFCYFSCVLLCSVVWQLKVELSNVAFRMSLPLNRISGNSSVVNYVQFDNVPSFAAFMWSCCCCVDFTCTSHWWLYSHHWFILFSHLQCCWCLTQVNVWTHYSCDVTLHMWSHRLPRPFTAESYRSLKPCCGVFLWIYWMCQFIGICHCAILIGYDVKLLF